MALQEVYGYAFKRMLRATIPFGVIAIVAACFALDSSQYLTNHTAVRMEKDVIIGSTQHGRDNQTSSSDHSDMIETEKHVAGKSVESKFMEVNSVLLRKDSDGRKG